MRDGKEPRNDKSTQSGNDPKLKDVDKGNDSRTPNPMDEGFVYYEE